MADSLARTLGARALASGYRQPEEQLERDRDKKDGRRRELLETAARAAAPQSEMPKLATGTIAGTAQQAQLVAALARRAAQMAQANTGGGGGHMDHDGLRHLFKRLQKKLPWLDVTSGHRSTAEQQALWKAARKKYGDPEIADNYVARPGTSAHESGAAIDVAREDIQRLVQWLSKHPWWNKRIYRPMSWEDWHFQLRNY